MIQKKMIQKSGSCQSIIHQYLKSISNGEDGDGDDEDYKNTVKIFFENFENLGKLNALILHVDSYNFSESGKGGRWVDSDLEISSYLLSELNYEQQIQEDYKNMLEAKYSVKQFNMSFERLFFADFKQFIYEDNENMKVGYAVFFSSFEKYVEKLGMEGIIQESLKIRSERYALTN